MSQKHIFGGVLLTASAVWYYAYSNGITSVKKPLHKVFITSGYEEYILKRNELILRKDGPVYEYFVSGRDQGGEMWCADCEQATPYIEKAVKESLPDGSYFIEASVGGLDYWKTYNEFRKYSGVKCVPLLRKADQQKNYLDDSACQSYGKIKEFLMQ